MPSYSRDYILSRVTDEDKGRAEENNRLIAAAKAGDQAALQKMIALAGDDSTGAWATNDARNHARMLLQEAGFGDQLGQFGDYAEARDGSFSVGKALGGALKFAAPIAAMAIPGIGPLAAAGIAAGGNVAGRALSGDKFSLGSTLLSGAAGAGGNWLLGGQGFKGIGGIPQRLGFGGGASAGAAGNATQGMPGVMGAAGGGGGAGGFSLGGALDAVGRYGPLVVGGLGAYQTMQDQSKANELRERGIKMAEQDYAGRAPFRALATSYAQRPEPQRADLSSIFYDPGNPFNRVQRPQVV